MSVHVASNETQIEMGSSMLKYQKERICDQVSEHVASAESLSEIGSSVLRYKRLGMAIE